MIKYIVASRNTDEFGNLGNLNDVGSLEIYKINGTGAKKMHEGGCFVFDTLDDAKDELRKHLVHMKKIFEVGYRNDEEYINTLTNRKVIKY